MNKIDVPPYWREAQQHLCDVDPVMAKLVARYDGESLRNRGDSFQTLARSVVGQQISTRAADSVWAKLEHLVEHVTPQSIQQHDSEQLRSAGLSQRKVEYILNIAQHYTDNGITDEHWRRQSYGATQQQLIAIKGIGRWTIEMFAIFYLWEPDVFSPGDIGIQKAIAELYFDGHRPSASELEAFSVKWQPYRTVALWYLWRHLDAEPVQY